MKKTVLFLTFFLIFAGCVFAQANPDYSGSWTLNTEKSQLDSMQQIQMMTIKVAQSPSRLTVETLIQRKSQSDSKNKVRGGEGTATYPLDGNELSVDVNGVNGKTPVKINGQILSDGRLSLKSSRTAIHRGVEFTLIVKDTWSLSADGKTLKINRVANTPSDGDKVTEMIFTKN